MLSKFFSVLRQWTLTDIWANLWRFLVFSKFHDIDVELNVGVWGKLDQKPNILYLASLRSNRVARDGQRFWDLNIGWISEQSLHPVDIYLSSPRKQLLIWMHRGSRWSHPRSASAPPEVKLWNLNCRSDSSHDDEDGNDDNNEKNDRPGDDGTLRSV